jgi:hypothetical protein
MPALALCAVTGKQQRPLRLLLAGWTVLSLGASYGFAGASDLITLVPAVRLSAFYRYCPPSWEFCLAVLAALAIDDIYKGIGGKVALWGSVGAVIAALAFCCLIAPHRLFSPPAAPLIWSAALAAGVLLALIVAGMERHSPLVRISILSSALVGEALCCFVYPTFRFPHSGSLEMAGVRFLQEHLGLQRFYSLGVISPNYGSYFGIAGINHNDLPVPSSWTDFVTTHLDPNTHKIAFDGLERADPKGQTAEDSLLAHLSDFEKVGVKYVISRVNDDRFGALLHGVNGDIPPVREVFADRVMRIYELPNPRDYFAAENCKLSVQSRQQLTSECSIPSTLLRQELCMVGWRVFVNGREQPVHCTQDIAQIAALPEGAAKVEFRFVPPFMPAGYAGAFFGCVLLALSLRTSRPIDRSNRMSPLRENPTDNK